MEKEKLRLDKYLWAIRLFKTRKLAVESIEKNKVKFNDMPVKPSKQVHIGDKYTIRTEQRRWIIEVTGLLHNRVAYSEAIKHYNDLTPPEEKMENNYQAASFYTGKRLSKVGRPTKKQQRDIDNFLNEQ